MENPKEFKNVKINIKQSLATEITVIGYNNKY